MPQLRSHISEIREDTLMVRNLEQGVTRIDQSLLCNAEHIYFAIQSKPASDRLQAISGWFFIKRVWHHAMHRPSPKILTPKNFLIVDNALGRSPFMMPVALRGANVQNYQLLS